jgi:hypothetical protein
MDIIAMSPSTSWVHRADVAVDTAIGSEIADMHELLHYRCALPFPSQNVDHLDGSSQLVDFFEIN